MRDLHENEVAQVNGAFGDVCQGLRTLKEIADAVKDVLDFFNPTSPTL